MTRKTAAAARELRRKKVLANLLAGVTYREMAAALDVSVGTIKNDVAIVLKRCQQQQADSAQQYVTLQNERLDRALNAIWADVLRGDTRAVTAMLKIEERRAKLNGSDAPEEVKLSGSVGHHAVDLTHLDDAARENLIDNLIRARKARRDAAA